MNQNTCENIENSSYQNINYLDVSPNDDLNILQTKINLLNEKISQEFYKLKNSSKSVTNVMENNYNIYNMNKDFNKHESVEEYVDAFIYKYGKIKELMKIGRELRYYKEEKIKSKTNTKKDHVRKSVSFQINNHHEDVTLNAM